MVLLWLRRRGALDVGRLPDQALLFAPSQHSSQVRQLSNQRAVLDPNSAPLLHMRAAVRDRDSITCYRPKSASQSLPGVFHGHQDGSARSIRDVSLPEVSDGRPSRACQFGVGGRRTALSLALVTGSKRVTFALAGWVSPHEDVFSVEPTDAVRLRHSNSSTARRAILSSFPPSRNACRSPAEIRFRICRSEQCHSF